MATLLPQVLPTQGEQSKHFSLEEFAPIASSRILPAARARLGNPDEILNYPRINLGSDYLSRGFEVIWLLPRGLLGLSVVVVSSSIRGFVLRPRGFLGRAPEKENEINSSKLLM